MRFVVTFHIGINELGVYLWISVYLSNIIIAVVRCIAT